MYIDTVFLSINCQNLLGSLSNRDSNILKSFSSRLTSKQYITENQSRLLLKILKDNNNILKIDDTILNNPVWKHPFRMLENVKKVYVDSEHIVIECTDFKYLKKEVAKLQSKIEGSLYLESSKISQAALTEANIVILVEEFSQRNFEISDQLQSYYDIIKSWKVEDYVNQYRINTITQSNFQKQISEDLGIDTPLTKTLIADRSRRFQYYISDQPEGSSLTEQIAYRDNQKVWVDKAVYSFNDILSSLLELKRLPILLVFNPNESKKIIEEVTSISESLKNHNITDKIGFYFRLPNTDPIGKQYNQIIADNNYNSFLTSDTQVVGIQSTKIPKFFINNEWKPMSVVAIDTLITNNKVAAYASCCDLIISYTKQQPIIESRKMWE